MNDDMLDRYQRLVEVTRLLADEAGEQIAAFRELANVTDEMAILFDQVYRDVELLHEHSQISAAARQMLDEVNHHFKMMSKLYELWTCESLAEDSEWDEMRRMARLALAEMGEFMQKPRLYWVQFTRAQ